MKVLFLLALASGSAMAAEADFLRCRALTDTAARLACYDAVPASASPSAAVAPVQTPEQIRQGFGLEQKRQEAAAQVVDSIESSINGRFEGWGPRSIIKLANGQVWQVADDTTAYWPKDNPKVTISRGVFGAFMLQVEGMSRVAKVRRIE